MNRQNVQVRPLYALGDGQWNIPELRLENIGLRRSVSANRDEQEGS